MIFSLDNWDRILILELMISNPYVARLLNSRAAPLAMELFLPHKSAYKEITESMSMLNAGGDIENANHLVTHWAEIPEPNSGECK